MAGRKTTLDLNEDLLEQAQKILNTTGIKDTIDAALFAVVALDARRRSIARLKEIDIDPDTLRREAWGQ